MKFHLSRGFIQSKTSLLVVALLGVMAGAVPVQAQTWNASPATGDWNTATNWTPNIIPNTFSDTAVFDATDTTGVSFTLDTSLGGMTFNASAPSYYIDTATANLSIGGTGIVNNSGAAQTINNGHGLFFENSSTAADAVIVNTNSGNLVFQDSSTAGHSTISNDNNFSFLNDSSAGNATITNDGTIGFAATAHAGNAVITNNATLLFDDSSSLQNSSITNNGGIFLDYNAAVSVATAGSATITNNSGLYFENNATAGSAVITMTSGSNADFNGDSAGGNARFIFQNALSLEGTINISGHSAGSVTVGSIEGDGVIQLGSNNFATGVNNLSTTFTGVINNNAPTTGSFTKMGTGTLFLTGTNTYAGGTTIAGGILEMSGVNSQLGTGAVQNNANLSFVSGSSARALTITNGFGGAALYFYDTSTAGSALVVNNAGSTVGFYDNTLANNAVIANNGVLEFHDSTTASSAAITNNGALSFYLSSSADHSTITTNNGGVVSLLGSSLGGTARFLVNTGGVFDISGHTGSVTVGSIEGDGAFHLGGNSLSTGINDQDTLISGVIDGSGTLIKLGTGTMTLLGNNTYSGGTDAESGLLAVASDSSLGNAAGSVTFNGGVTFRTLGSVTSSRSLVVNSGGGVFFDTYGHDSTFGGNISGTGLFTKIGDGVLTLSGNNDYSNRTVIDAGTIAVGSATALGSGTVDVTGGTLSSNGTARTINVGGDYVQSAGGTLKLGLGVGSDSLNVAQAANLTGTLDLFNYGLYTPTIGDAVTILTAGNGVNGRFSQIIDPAGSRWFPIYDYLDKDIYLLALQPSFAAVALTRNQTAVGTMLDDEFLTPQYQNLILAAGVKSSSALPAIYDQIAPEELTALYQIGYASARNHAALVESRLSAIREDASKPSAQLTSWNTDGPMLAADLPPVELKAISDSAAKDDRWGVFMMGGKNIGTVSSDANTAGYQMTNNGIAAGADYRIGKDIEAGLLLTFDQTDTTSAGGAKLNASGAGAGLYGGWHPGGFFLEALAEGGINSYKTSRQGYGAEVTGETQGTKFSGWLGSGYDWKIGSFKISPYAAGQISAVQLNAFSEQGSMAPLDFGAQSQSALSSELGTKFDWTWKIGALDFKPRIGIAWEHQFQGTQDNLTSGLSGGGESFTVQGVALGQDVAVAGAELNIEFARGLSGSLQYRGKFGQTNYDSQSFTGGMSVGF